MSNQDLEDALARALDLLPEGDPARDDPRLARNPALAAEARAARETAADVWLAVSPLRAAPPEALPAILRKISPVAAAKPAPRWPLATGWAAAAAIALAWWIHHSVEVSKPTPAPDAAAISTPAEGRERIPSMAAPARERQPHAERERLRRELAQLREAIQYELGADQPGWSPRITALSAPGATPVDPDVSRNRLMAVLTGALRGLLEGDDALLVIERGWLPQGALELADDEWVRHRNFPQEEWSEHGLLMSGDGRFYDPAQGLLWTADTASTDFIGRRVRAEDGDLAEFQRDVERPAEPTVEPQRFVEKAPSGFLIEDPSTGDAQLLVEGLRPPPDGSSYQLVGASLSIGPIGNTFYSPNIVFDHSGSHSLIPLTNFRAAGLSSFSLIQVNQFGITEAVIITGGN